MKKKQLEALYLKHEAQIAHHAWSWHRTTGLEVAELISVGRSAFMKAAGSHDPTKATFSTWLHNTLFLELRKFADAEWRRGPKLKIPPDEAMPDTGVCDPAFRLLALRDWITELSEEARFVASLIIESPAVLGLTGTEPPKLARGKIVRFLQRRGWSQKKRWGCLSELKQRLSDL